MGFCIVQYETVMATTPGEAGEHRGTLAEAFAECMFRISSAAVASAAVLAAGGAWKQEAADSLLSAVTWLCSWLLLAAAAGPAEVIGVLQEHVQQQVAMLLSDGGPVTSALAAASAGCWTELATHIANWVDWALQHSDTARLPPLSLAAKALRMQCDAGGRGPPLTAGCLRTSRGQDRLRAQARVLRSRRAGSTAAKQRV